MMVAVLYDDSGRRNRTYGYSGPGAKLVHVAIISITVGSLLLANRLYWRWHKRTLGADDTFVVIAWSFLIALGAISYEAVNHGYSRPQATLTRQEASDAEKFFFIYQILYKLSINFSKLSILKLYLRTLGQFPIQPDWFRGVTMCLIVVVSCYTISATLANIFNCTPISINWDTSPHSATARSDGRCINILAFWYASALYNIISEVLMLLAVLIKIWAQPAYISPPVLRLKQKISLTAVTGLGVFTAATAILRMTTLSKTAMAADKTAGTLTSTIWSSIEAGLGVTVANLPMLRQLLRECGRYGAVLFGSTADRGDRRHSSHALHSTPPSHHGRDSIRKYREFERRVVMSDTDISSVCDTEIGTGTHRLLLTDSGHSPKITTEARESVSATSFNSSVQPAAPTSMIQTSIESGLLSMNLDRADAILPVLKRDRSCTTEPDGQMNHVA